MSKVSASQTIDHVNQEVTLQGWVNTRRDHGKIIFIDLRDVSGIVQVVCGQDAAEVRGEYVIEVQGKVANRPAQLVNKNIATGQVEVQARQIKILRNLKS